MLEGTNIAIGITGSIAAVKVVEIIHELRRRGANVRGIITSNATKIIHPWSIEFATGNAVVTNITGSVEHIELCGFNGWADVLVIVPATANTIGKMAASIDDTPVTTCVTTAIGSKIPIVVAPAMHEPMANHPGIIEAQMRLESWGLKFVSPIIEEGKAKVADIETIITEIERAIDEKPLLGKHIIVTSGATYERIDPVRVITNSSSGKTGYGIARGCYIKGAKVSLIHNGMEIPYMNTYQVDSSAEMIDCVLKLAENADGLVSVAAIADYGIEALENKIKSTKTEIELKLFKRPKLLDVVREKFPDLLMIGFKAEMEKDQEIMIGHARELLKRVNLSFVVANDTEMIGLDDTEVLVVREKNVIEIKGPKKDVGLAIAEEISKEIS
jgi:phosphopantothenoylcysteine decarboxylase/phosphopantothenate--cysteine ligase